MSTNGAVLFDIDGTLIDSNYLHVYAWQRAFADVGVGVETWRIHRSIGMDGATLVRTLSNDAPDETQRRLKDAHSHYYFGSTTLLRPLPGAQQLLDRVAGLGLQVVLATSAHEDELAVLRKILDRDELVSATTSSVDVDTAKPNPEILSVALDRVGAGIDEAVFIGDTVWDAKACVRIGLANIGVLTGGISSAELETAGATQIFEGPEQLVSHLHQTPIADLISEPVPFDVNSGG